MYAKQGTLVDPDERKQLVWEMQQMIYDNCRLHAARERGVHRRPLRQTWTGIETELNAYSKKYWTSPYMVGISPDESRGGRRARGVRSADYVIKRVLFAIVTVFVAITLNFVLFRAVPGDAVDALRCRQCSADVQGDPAPGARPRQVEVGAVPALHHRSRPRATSARSLRTQKTVRSELWEPLKNTIPMVALGTLFSIVFGTLTGVISRLATGHRRRQGRASGPRSASTRCRPSGSGS